MVAENLPLRPVLGQGTPKAGDKTELWITSPPQGGTLSEKRERPVDEDVEKLEPTRTVGENVRWAATVESSVAVHQNIPDRITI